MKEKIDGYLSRKAQGHDPTALVVCQTTDAGDEEWLLRRKDGEMGLGDSFGAARASLLAWMRAERQRAKP